MNFKQFVSATLLVIAPSLSFAEAVVLKAENLFISYNLVYPNLDLSNISDINIHVDKTFIDNGFQPEFNLKKVEFKFPNANNLNVKGFEKLAGSNDTYRAIVTSPWVFKKVMIEVKAYDFKQDQNIEISVIVVENSSSINNITVVEGERLFGGSATLIDVSYKKVVDVLRTSYLGKPLTLRLYDKTLSDAVQIQAIWMGYGSQILNLNAPTQPNLKPVTLLSETIFNDERIKVQLTDGNVTFDSPDESLRFLLEQKFGPLPNSVP
jgi:hypothetical protein